MFQILKQELTRENATLNLSNGKTNIKICGYTYDPTVYLTESKFGKSFTERTYSFPFCTENNSNGTLPH